MSEASIRTIAWREQKRQEGYQPVTIWIPAAVKNAMANLAFQRYQDLGELIVEAFQAWSPTKGGKPVAFAETHRLTEIIDRRIAAALAGQHLTPQLPAAPEAEAPPLPEGMKQYSDPTHPPYDARRKECPHHARERQQRSRANKANERRGIVPA